MIFNKNKETKDKVVINQLNIALESVRVEHEFSDIRNMMMNAIQNKMPFLPIKNWLDRLKNPCYVSCFANVHIELIEARSNEIKQLAEMFGYSYSDINGFAIKTNGGKEYSPIIKELALIKGWEMLYNLDETTLIESISSGEDYESIMKSCGDDIDGLAKMIYEQMNEFVSKAR